MKIAPFSGRAPYPDGASALLDDALYDTQTQPGAFASLLGGVKRLEDPLHGIGFDPVAGVRDRQEHARAGRHAQQGRLLCFQNGTRSLDPDPPLVRHGVPGVQQQVHDDLFHLSRVGHYQSQPGLQLDGDLEVLSENWPEHALDIRDQGIEVERIRAYGFPSSEAQQLRRQSRAPLGGLANLVDRLTARVLIAGAVQ